MRPAALIEPSRHRFWRFMAWAWLLLVLAVGVHQLRFWSGDNIESNVLALLPEDAQDPALEQATRRIVDAGARQIVVLLGAADDAQAKAAANAYRAELQRQARQEPLPFVENTAMSGWFNAAQAYYRPYRDRLLTDAQRQQLQDTPPDALAQQALSALYGPLAAPRWIQWQADPLNLWSGWWQARAADAGMRFDADGLLRADGRVWVVLQFQTRGPAFRLDGVRRIDAALDAARAVAARTTPGLQELRSGVPLYAEAAAVQASREINVIGWGSLLAVLALVWLAFRSLRPILLVALSLLVGVAVALSATALVFGKVHLLTLIFGASLVGVAEDYGIHWFASRQAHPGQEKFRLLHGLLPGMLLALVTSALAYLALGAAPFPGLRQMAVFSVVGLLAAFATVACWFPWLAASPPPPTRLAGVLAGWLDHWPQPRSRRAWYGLAALATIVTVGGLLQLRSNDDLRSLQSLPKPLLAQQEEITKILGMPSPAQFYLVLAPDTDTLLQREQQLTQRLRPLVASGTIGGYRAISDWLPSRQQQAADAALLDKTETQVLAQVSQATGEHLQRPAFVSRAMTLRDWLASPVSQPFRPLWLGQVAGDVATVVLVDAQGGDAMLARLQAQATGLPGVRWVNRTAEYSSLLGHYRRMISGLLGVGLALVLSALYLRYRRDAWRTLLPTLLATVLTLALLGWLGQPLQLFNVLALLLLIGLGEDYGIFLREHAGDASAWLAVCVGAASTWLSFGLLALSATPALRAFGLTLLIGIGLVWLLSPMFRPQAEHEADAEHALDTPTAGG